MTAVAALMIAHRPALAGPDGGTVVRGSASIQQSGSTTNINQSSGKAIINWQGFSIGSGETVNFNQPSSQSATLNRVIGNETSVISGALNANGQVFIVNSAGVLFGKGAQVNVGGLVASTLDISNENFMAGRYTFSGDSSASVINRGRIHASDGGSVALLGKTVANDGVIVANLGTVAMAAGQQITLNFGGDALLDVTIDKGALNALVANRRAIIANGGRVVMTAKAADEVLSAQVNNSGIIQARTMAALTGGSATARKGSIKLLANGGTTRVSGKLDASAPSGGDGGAIETSGDRVKIAPDAIITTKAAYGSTGTWTIDPDGFTIGTDGDITGAQLSSQLASNNVTIFSTDGHGADGNINVNDAVSWSANTLTLNATNNIYVNNVMTATGTAGFAGNYGRGTNADSTPMGLYTNLGAVNGSYGGRFDFSGSGGFSLNGTAYTVINDVGGLAAARSNPGGLYVLGSNLTAGLSASWTTPLDNGTAFTGTFNGLGHVIGSFTTTGTSLFGTIGSSGSVSNLGINNANVSANPSNPKTAAGILADVNQGSIINSFVSGGNAGGMLTVAGSVLSAGTLVGNNSGLIAQSYSANTSLAGITQVGGGLVGTNLAGGRITESSVREDTAGGYSGGFIYGHADTITYTGGFVGVNNGTVEKSYTQIGLQLDGNAVSPTSNATSGGFVGLNTGTIQQSYSTLDPLSQQWLSGQFVAGFVGANSGTISNVYTTSLTDAFGMSNWTAGFVYRNTGTIRNSHAIAYAFYPWQQYGFAFDNTGGTISNSYWNTPNTIYTTPTTLDNSNAVNLNDTQAVSLASYVGYDPAIWAAALSGFPILRNTPVYVSTSAASVGAYGDIHTTTGTLLTQGLQGGGGGLSVLLPDNATVYNLFSTFTVRTTDGYIDAGTSAAASVLGSTKYSNIRGTVTVDPKLLTVSGLVQDKTYDGTTAATFTPDGTALLFGLVGNQLLNVTYNSVAFADKNSGANKTININGTLSDGANGGKASNYRLANTTSANIAQKTISVSATGNDKIYDGTTAATLSTQLSGSVAGDNLSVGVGSATFADKNAGTGKTITASGLTLTGSDSGNYILSNTSLLTTASIAPRPLSLSGAKAADGSTSIAANDLSAMNVVAGDSVQLGGSVTIASAAAGNQPIVDLSALTVGNPNYTVVGSSGSVQVGGGSLVLDHVASGSVSFDYSVTNTTKINQTTDSAIIDWLRFSIAANETVSFVQPSRSSVTLNRVTGNESTVIAGALNANGRVFVLNSAGVLFTAGSSVNAGALVASTLNISDSDFTAGNYRFTANGGSGSVIANGNITVGDVGGVNDGNIGFVALASSNGVTHTGSLTAARGDVVLASASGLNLTLSTTGSGLSHAVGSSSYVVGSLSGATAAAGSINVSSPNGNGGLVETAGTSVDISGLTLNTGSNGAWSWTQSAAISIGPGGFFTKQFVENNLATRSLALNSQSGDVTVNAELAWSSNTTLTLGAGRDVNINASINSTGAAAGLTLNYGHDYNIATRASYSGVTPAGIADTAPAGTSYASINLNADAILTINRARYTLIDSMSDLAGITGPGNYALVKNLDQNLEAPGTPYGDRVIDTLNGTLAGLGHTISNLTITNTANTNTGLIGTAEAGSTIRDLGLLNVKVSGLGANGPIGVGALVGLNYADINHVYSTGTVSGQGNVGGLVGLNERNPSPSSAPINTISNSFSDANVTGGPGGGLVGRAEDVDIYNSHATGQITSASNGGGLVGLATNVNVYNSYAKGNLMGGATPSDPATAAATDLGGLIGQFQNGGNTIRNSFADGSVTGGTSLGGLVGSLASGYGNTTVEGSHATGDVTSYQTAGLGLGRGIGGLIGSASSDATSGVYQLFINNSYATGDVAYKGSIGDNAGGLVGYWNGPGVISNSSASGSVQGSTNGFATGGLVGSANSSTIINSSATGAVSGNSSVGGLTGNNNGTIVNSSATGSVTGNDNVGGLAGNNVGSITGSRASGTVNGQGVTGGLVGTNIGSINQSYFTGRVTGPPGLTGGIAGANINTGVINQSFFNSDLNPGLSVANAPPPPPGFSGNPGYISGSGGLTNAQAADIQAYANGTITQVQAYRAAAEAAARAAAEAAARAAAEAAARAAAEAAARAAAQAAAEAAARAAAAAAAAQQAAAARAVAQQAASTAGAVVANTENSAKTPPSAAASAAGTRAVASPAAAKIDDNVKAVEDDIKTEDERARRRLAAAAARSKGAGGGSGLGASIRTIDIDGQRFDLNGASKKPAPNQNPP